MLVGWTKSQVPRERTSEKPKFQELKPHEFTNGQVQYPGAEEAEEQIAVEPPVVPQEPPPPAQGPQAQSPNNQ